MSIAYDTFMKQYHATGSEKADGYSRSAFIGLTPSEKEEVFRLLATELPWSVEWLFFVDAERALPIAVEAEKQDRNNPYGDTYMLQAAIVNYTGDLTYQEHMIQDYPAYHKSEKRQVISAINRTPTNETTIGFFKNLILTETNPDAVAGASIYFLNSRNVSNVTQRDRVVYDRLLDELRSDDTSTKLRAIAQVESLTRLADSRVTRYDCGSRPKRLDNCAFRSASYMLVRGSPMSTRTMLMYKSRISDVAEAER